MGNPEHVASLCKGVEAWNKWREENPEVKPSLGKTDRKGTVVMSNTDSVTKVSVRRASQVNVRSSHQQLMAEAPINRSKRRQT